MAAILSVRDENGNFIEIPAIQGPKGDKGEKGDGYIITDADKQEIVQDVLKALPLWEGGAY